MFGVSSKGSVTSSLPVNEHEFLKPFFGLEFEESSECHLLVQKYGWVKIEEAVGSINNRINKIDNRQSNQSSKVKEIFKKYKMIEDAILERSPFAGRPCLIGISKEGLPLIQWENAERDAFRFVDAKLPCENETIERECIPTQEKEQFACKEEMLKVFNYFQRSLPIGNVATGCDERCMWMSFLLTSFYKIHNQCVRVRTSSSFFLDLQPPFDSQKIKWDMHIAPVVICANDKYVFDLVLAEPILYDRWINSLEPNLSNREIKEYKHKEILGIGVEDAESLHTRLSLLRLSGLYLFENVDGNVGNSTSERTVSYWSKGDLKTHS